MTKIEALIKCKRQWQYMADTGTRFKHHYFVLIGIPSYDRPSANCYCCEYDDKCVEAGAVDCASCPLTGYAWEGACDQEGSLFKQWEDAETIEERVYWAELMVDACDMALSDLKEK